ncbi:MAG: PIN domain-containing protein [Treponema sp.]|nr:PIN domain-containing protein [Treponema sp.]
MQNSYVLDACALIAFFKREEGWECVSDLIEKSLLGELRLIMSKYNLLEVYYGFYGNDGREKAEEILLDVLSLPIRIVGEAG